MRSTYVYHWACNWIFKNINTSPLHTDHLLHTSHFNHDHMTLFRLDTRFQDALNPTTMHNQCEGHFAFMPVHTSDNITVGYVMAFPSDPQRQVLPVHQRPPCAPPFIARFILDHSVHELIMFVPCLYHRFISVHTYHLNTPRQYTFIIPANEYDWYHLPDYPKLIMEGSAESPFCSPPDSSTNNRPTIPFSTNSHNLNQINETELADDHIHDLFSRMKISHTTPSSSFTVTNFTNTNSPPVASLWSDQPLSCHPASSTSDEGVYFIPHEQQQVIQQDIIKILQNRKCEVGACIAGNPFIIPGYEYFSQLTNLHHIFCLADPVLTSDFNTKSAFVYYSSRLRVTNDERLVSSSMKLASEKNQHSRQNQNTIVLGNYNIPPLAPLLQPLQQDHRPAQKKDRETILHERRQRNRMSAARSNARKQERMDQMERELEETKAHVYQLQQRERKMQNKNKQLKELVSLINPR